MVNVSMHGPQGTHCKYLLTQARPHPRDYKLTFNFYHVLISYCSLCHSYVHFKFKFFRLFGPVSVVTAPHLPL
jgi:hypothetical protein